MKRDWADDEAERLLPGEFLPGGLTRAQMAAKKAEIAAALRDISETAWSDGYGASYQP